MNEYGQLGNGNTGADRNVPVAVQNLTDLKSVKAGSNHGLALKKDGTVWAWGDNSSGQLGDGTNGDDRTTPVDVRGLSNVRSVSGGEFHSLTVLNDGKARSWEDNGYGQLGLGTNGSTTNSNYPVEIDNLSNVKNMDGGYGFTLAATK